VHRIITEKAVMDVMPAGLELVEVMSGETLEGIQAVTEPRLRLARR
jgi:acyl CoA:acetate/3-ketoacid CoA transferase beta subunit